MYMVIMHDGKGIHWARAYLSIIDALCDANKWSELLGGHNFPYDENDLKDEFKICDKVTMDTDDGYSVSVMMESGRI